MKVNYSRLDRAIRRDTRKNKKKNGMRRDGDSVKNIEAKEGEDEDDNDDFELKLELDPESPLAFNEESVKTVRKRGRPKKGTSSETPVKKVKSNDSLSKKDKIKKRDLQEQIREMDEAIKKFMPIKCDLCFEEVIFFFSKNIFF